MAKIHLELYKNGCFHWFLFSDFHNFHSLAGLSSPNPRQKQISKFPKFFSKFSPTCDKTLKNFEKIAKFSRNFFKNCKWFIDFLQIFWKILLRPGGGAPPLPKPPGPDPTYKPPLVDIASPRKKFMRPLLHITLFMITHLLEKCWISIARK